MGNDVWQISHKSESYELQRFPVLRRRIEEVVANFLREGLAPAETMIGHLIEMEVRKGTNSISCVRPYVRNSS